MPDTKRYAIDINPEYASREMASFVAQLDNLSERMLRDLGDISVDDLAWQSAPGMNTIGMLLAHIAIVEVYWIERVIARNPDTEAGIFAVLGVTGDTDGIPLASDGQPPIALARNKPYFAELLRKAREHTKGRLIGFSDRDMEQDSPLPDYQKPTTASPRWTLYHILEHQAGHYGQILLIMHQLEAARAKRPEAVL